MSDFDKNIDYYNENRNLKLVIKNHEKLIDLQRSQLQLALSLIGFIREQARERKDFVFADYIRDEFAKVKVTFHDKIIKK